MRHDTRYTFAFVTAVCVVCALVVSSAAVLLKPRQRANVELDRQRNVLEAAGLVDPGERVDPDDVRAQFRGVEPVAVDLKTGTPRRGAFEAGEGEKVVYRLEDESGNLRMVILPVEGKGLWSTLRGFLALRADLRTVEGLTFYEHKETPGLGGEVDNPRWRARWRGRQAFDDQGILRLEVARGPVGSVEEDPFRVDGLSGATITTRGVHDLVRYWLGEEGFGPYLETLARKEGADVQGP